MGYLLKENRHGLVVDVELAEANGRGFVAELRALDEEGTALPMRQTFEQDLGWILLRAVGRAGKEPAKFVVPIVGHSRCTWR